MDFVSADDLKQLIVSYGYLAILLVVAAESMGIPVPGESTLILASIYAGISHHLDIGLVILAAIAGAILGDNLGFLAGKYGGRRLLQRYGRYLRWNERRLRMGNYLFEVHGGKVVFFGRFLPILRIWAALLAGVHQMNWSRFLFYNAAGGVVWATTIGGASYIFGNSLLRAGGLIGTLSMALAVGALILVVLASRRAERRLAGQMEAGRGEAIGRAPRRKALGQRPNLPDVG